MQRMTVFLMVLLCFFVLPTAPASAWLFNDDTLVTIDNTSYSSEDFKRWWQFWNTDKEPVPQTLDTYIDWQLLKREAQRMELDQDPGFKRQTRIFLQSRGLLMLKYEVVDSKIDVSDAVIEARYQRDYLPRWNLQRLIFEDDAKAAAAWNEVTTKGLSIDELRERPAAEGGPESGVDEWVRPHAIDPGWVEILRTTDVGTLVPPERYDGGRVLYYLKDEVGADDLDRMARRDGIRRDLWKEQENELTIGLLRDLYKKYEVNINQERLDALDLMAEDSAYTDEPVITTNRENVSEKQFIAVVRRLQESRPTAAHAAIDAEKSIEFKNETAGNILGQSLTNWESLDRKFEEREPFKWEYQFNYDHRLVLSLEQRLFLEQARPTDEQIEAYYDKNLSRFTQPAMVKLYIIDETQGPVDRFWAEVATGKEFRQVLRDHFEQRINAQEIPVNHLDPEVKPVVDRLVKGETSRVFTAQGIKVMVHLEERTPERPLPLERVRDSIRTELQQQNLKQVRQEYLDRLKQQTRIDVKNRQWRSVRKELGGA